MKFLILPLLIFILVFFVPEPVHLIPKVTPKYNEEDVVQEEVLQNKTLPIANLTNEEFMENHTMNTIQLDDTVVLEEYRDTLSWIPRSFGYSEKEGRQVFPLVKYPKCSEAFDTRGQSVKINTQDNVVEFNCKNKATDYILGPTQEDMKLVTLANTKKQKNESTKNKSVPLGKSEFVLTNCGEESYEYASMRPQYQEGTHKNAKSNMTPNSEPTKIYHIAIDSFSRRHIFRKLGKTVEWVNQLNKGDKYRVFDFKMHSVIGKDSISNQAMVLAGYQPNKISRIGDNAKETGLWNELRELGFVSLMGLESCNKDFAPSLGRGAKIDHTVNEFYWHAWGRSANIGKWYMEKQRWIGDKMSHWYTLNYTLEFSQLYHDVHQWGYLHLNAAHEPSGHHGITLDEDLQWFLSELLSENAIIFLEGDHGMRYGDWYSSDAAHFESKLPVLFVISSTTLLNRFPGVYSTLMWNTYHLTSKLEIRKTIRQIAYAISGQEIKEEARKNDLTGFSLISDLIPNSVNCQDEGIPTWHCPCAKIQQVHESIITRKDLPDENMRKFSDLVYFLAYEIVAYINVQIRLHNSWLCQTVTFGRIEEVYGMKDSKVNEVLKMILVPAENDTVRFEALLQIGENGFLKGQNQQGPPILPVHYRGHKKVFRIVYISRQDRYQGKCEQLAVEHNVAGLYCLCHDQFL